MSRRRYRPRPSIGMFSCGLALLALLAFRAWQETRYAADAPPADLDEQNYQVARVIDGDTLLLTNHARVRLIGVDTPETVKPQHAVEAWGPEATQFTRGFVAAGQVRLQFDKQRLDRYDRFLAYVWVEERLLNEELVRAGLARVEPGYDYSPAMKTRFRRAEAQARAARRGLWSSPERDSAAEKPAGP